MGLKKFFKPAFECKDPECRKHVRKDRKVKQHNVEFVFSGDVRQSEESTRLFALNVTANVICSDCGLVTPFEGVLSEVEDE